MRRGFQNKCVGQPVSRLRDAKSIELEAKQVVVLGSDSLSTHRRMMPDDQRFLECRPCPEDKRSNSRARLQPNWVTACSHTMQNEEDEDVLMLAR